MVNTISGQAAPMGQLAAALAKAQATIQAPQKKRKVDFTHNGKRTHYNYADLADVIEAIRAPLAQNGLAITHVMTTEESQFGMRTWLLHDSGEAISTWYPLPQPQGKPQEFGSALTYARRYSISALVGIASEEDDDGALGQQAGAEAPRKPGGKTIVPPKPPFSPKPKGTAPQKPRVDPDASSEAQRTAISKAAFARNLKSEDVVTYMQAVYGVDKGTLLTRVQADEMKRLFEDLGTTAEVLRLLAEQPPDDDPPGGKAGGHAAAPVNFDENLDFLAGEESEVAKAQPETQKNWTKLPPPSVIAKRVVKNHAPGADQAEPRVTGPDVTALLEFGKACGYSVDDVKQLAKVRFKTDDLASLRPFNVKVLKTAMQVGHNRDDDSASKG